MPLPSFLSWLKPKAQRAEAAKNELAANAEKALRLKQDGDPQARIPPHRTASAGMQPHDDPHISEATRGAEAGFTPQMKRSHTARSRDAS